MIGTFCLISLFVISTSMPIQKIEVPAIELEGITANRTATNRTLQRNTIRPGILISNYAVELQPDYANGRFSGTLLAQVQIVDAATREDDIVLHAGDLDVSSVQFAVGGGTNFNNAEFELDGDDTLLTITTGQQATLYTLRISYTGSLGQSTGLFSGTGGYDYLAMNLYPTNARRVFPCIDELTETSIISFTFNGVNFPTMVANSMLEDNSQTQFRPLQGPPHRWGMIAHGFSNINIPVANVILSGRPGLAQDAVASLAINNIFTTLNEWTAKNFFEIVVNQDGRLNIVALPDVSMDWNSLSVVGIWEPYLFMETQHSMKQRMLSQVKIAETLAGQWFGYAIYPENWIHEWVIRGLQTYAAYEAVKAMSSNENELDYETLFITEVFQESLYRDAYPTSPVLEAEEEIFDEASIRDHVNGIVKYKAPALMSLLRLILNPEDDFIQIAARGLLNTRSLQPVNSLNFIDAINGQWTGNLIDDVEEFLEPYLTTNGYPLLVADVRLGNVFLSLERFGFSPQGSMDFEIPITYTVSNNPDFSRVVPSLMMGGTTTLNLDAGFGEEDWVLFNIQGRGYYRVMYDLQMWEVIIEALEDPERRNVIHPMNRATLVDDALNLARANRLNYDIAFRVVLSMEHETDYAVWRAFVRNMGFLKKRLEAYVFDEDDERDPDIYLRMVRRTIGSIEEELGFSPDPQISEPAMTSLTRGMVMDHACRAGYAPCIAAAVDWFYDPNSNEPAVNPNIPHDLRPAVYCAVVRDGDQSVRELLLAHLEDPQLTRTLYDRVVILESLACSEDDAFIASYLQETVAADSPYTVEEKMKIFVAVASSSYTNAIQALRFMRFNTANIRERYGGPAKLEKMIFALADNIVDADMAADFEVWVGAINSDLDDSLDAANRALTLVQQNIRWSENFLDFVYEWIDENDATTAAVSMFLLCITVMITVFNH